MGSKAQGVQEILEKYMYKMSSPPQVGAGDGTHGAGPLGAVLYSNSFAANPWHGHLTYL